MNILLDAFPIVSTWDLPEEDGLYPDVAQAVKDQARLMSGVSPDEEAWEDQPDIH